MNASLPTTEQHWDELHEAESHSVGDVLRNAAATFRRNPLVTIGTAMVVGVAVGTLLLRGRSTPAMRKFLKASALPLATKGMHEAGNFIRHQAASTGKTARKQLDQGLKNAGHWLDSFKH